MDTNLARRITALQYEIDNLDAYAEELEKPEDIETVKVNLAKMQAQMDVLIHTAQRQLVIDAAREATLESYRR